MTDDPQTKTLPDRLHARMYDAPADFADIRARAAVDKAMQRLVTSSWLRRIERGFFD